MNTLEHQDSSDMPTTIRLKPEIESRLDVLVRETGRSKSFYLRQLIEDNLADIEDIYLSEKRLEELRAGRSESLNADEVWGDLDD
jgi:RHH-type transcriptional regulator, rel operon repressor / antitoxin RelB